VTVGVVGTGALGKALVLGLAPHVSCVVYDKVAQRAADVAQATGCRAVGTLDELETIQPDWIILVVKPGDVEGLASQLRLPAGQRLVSCLAGVTLGRLAQLFPDARVARILPNLMVRYGQGATALALHSNMTPEVEALQKLLQPLGRTYQVDEQALEKLSALTGSGPAFMFLAAEAMMDGAIAIGIPASEAQAYVAQLFHGVGAALEQDSPARLRQSVCSPAGTTIQGIRQLERAGMRSALIEALIATYQRGQELKR
jgi:pyrroline-5-carboxylate reductase